MKILNENMIDTIESTCKPKGTWDVVEHLYGKFKLSEKITFYENDEHFYCIIYGKKCKAFQYDSREDGNKHFNYIKRKTEEVGLLFTKDVSSK